MSKLARTQSIRGGSTPLHQIINVGLTIKYFVLVLYIFVNMGKYMFQSHDEGLSISTAHSFTPSRHCHHKYGNNNNILVTVLSEINL